MSEYVNLVYLAAKYSRRDELKGYVKQLAARGVGVTSRWLLENEPLQCKLGDHPIEFYQETSLIDLEDIRNADAIVFFSEDPLVGTPRGGRHVEFGYALGINKKMIVIGEPENIFHYLPWIEFFPNIEAFLKKYANTAVV
jgi:hypothetical protein